MALSGSEWPNFSRKNRAIFCTPASDQLAAPFPEFSGFLRELAAGQLPPVPHGLPAELGQWLEDLAQAIRDAPRGSTP